MLLTADIDPETFGTFYEAFKEVLISMAFTVIISYNYTPPTCTPAHPSTCTHFHIHTLLPAHPPTCTPSHLHTLSPAHPPTCTPLPQVLQENEAVDIPGVELEKVDKSMEKMAERVLAVSSSSLRTNFHTHTTLILTTYRYVGGEGVEGVRVCVCGG